jgi:cell wall-associated NlpC family hydrolase
MRSWLKSVAIASLSPALWAFGLQGTTQQSAMTDFATTRPASRARGTHIGTERLLTPDDGLAIISAALDTQRRFGSNRDCSHLVHAVYERAGFPYLYASADDLYDGLVSFRRVFHPQTGDLIVWHGHVGIVVRPSRHVFFSFLSAGPGTDNYRSPYWIGRGEARFYRYIKK